MIPGDGPADVAVAQLGQTCALFRVVLAAVFDQLVDTSGWRRTSAWQRPAGADRAQLVVVADEHQLRSGGLDARGEGDQVDVLGHAHLVADDQAAVVEGQPAVVEPPDRLARVRDSAISASLPRLRAACPDVAVPTTRQPAPRRRRPRPEAGWSSRRRPRPR